MREFRRAGHTPSLVAALLHFDVSFAVWVILGALGAYIAEDLGLSAAEKGVLVAVPLLSAAVFRVTLGVLADRFGPRRIGTISMAVALLPLLWGWLGATSMNELLGVGVLLGVAGASFAISLPLASRWYPPQYQGLAMGIAGAGNSGTVACALLAPRLAEHVGWHGVMGLALIPAVLVLIAFRLLAKEPPAPAQRLTLNAFANQLGESDTWKLCALYAVTFGGFVGLSSFLPIFFHDEYGLSKVDAASLAAIGGAAGSFVRPFGGHLADRLGGTRVLTVVYGVAAPLLLALSSMPSLLLAGIGFPIVMAFLGLGNGATFQLVGLRFGARIGVVTGLVGAAGGLGGFMLPIALGSLHDSSGSYGTGLSVVAGVVFVAFVGVAVLRAAWRRGWGATAEAPV
ncbi:MFS transporter [Solirubrobacter phytolaccae]|uniref:MFS transporter n=2 Tax=Solirubrobacter phytolaccae TaxID=1404360 RepID=A0A9X3NE74_9ACTN|nr:MFS transporter [Solirubrobacter phytolaccae]MDA0182441.1 MFS transporter [Solirubrobacter phytolaccae]